MDDASLPGSDTGDPAAPPSTGDASSSGVVPDSFQARFPGYVRDPKAEARHYRPFMFLILGGLAVGIVGFLVDMAGATVAGVILCGVSASAFFVGVILHSRRRRPRCSNCGRPMEVVETGVTPAEMTPAERFATLRGTARARQRWLVCHPCKRYWQAWRSVQGTDD